MQLTQQRTFDMRKPRIFVLEGPDCSGKSSLAKFLCNRLNAAYFHSTWSEALSGEAQLQCLEKTLQNAEVCLTVSGLDVVLDRHWPSESCYGNIFRNGYSHEHAERLSIMMLKLRDLHAIYIYCEGDFELYQAIKDAKHSASLEQYLSLCGLYKDHANCIYAIGNIVEGYDIKKHGFALDDFLASLNINS